MNTLERYVGMRLCAHIGVALLAFVAVFSLLRFAQELRYVEAGGYSVGAVSFFVLLMVPAEAYRLLPSAVLVGSVNALGELARGNELLAISMAGVSHARILWIVLRVVIVLAGLGAAAGEIIAPGLARFARAERSVALSSGMALAAENGFWLRDQNRFVNVRRPHADGTLEDVYIYEVADRRLSMVIRAARATHVNGQWVLEDVREKRLDESGVHDRELAAEPWAIPLTPQQIGALVSPLEDLSGTALAGSADAARRRGEDTSRFELALWSRISTPLAAVVMVFLAIPVMLRVGARASTGRRSLVAALAGLSFQTASQILGGIGLVYGLSPAVGASLPLLVAALVGVWSLRSAP